MHLILSILILLAGTNAYGMDFLQKFQIIDDKLKFSNTPLPYKSYFLETNLHLNYDYPVIQQDIENLNNSPSEEEVNSFIDRYSGEVKNININAKLGVKLFEETTYNFSWKTYFQASYDFSIMALLYQKTLSFGDIESLFPQTLPLELKQFISQLTPGTDIIDACKKSLTLSQESLALCSQYPKNVYFMPQPDQKVPNFIFLSKKDFKIGFLNHFKNGNFLGSFYLYGLRREDFYRLITPDQLSSKSPDLFDDKVANREDTLQLDYSFGYYGKNQQFLIAFEEMKLLTLKPRKEESKPLFYPYSSLVKMQSSSSYEVLNNCYLGHIVGFQNRAYSVLDGMFGGINGQIIWLKNSLGFEIIYDSFFWSFTPRLVYNSLSLEYGFKLPAKKSTYDLELAPIQSLNVGFSF